MILQESKTVPIAEADWTDDGEVELVTFPTPDGYRTCMTPETARALAEQLKTAAADAEKAAAESGVQRAHRTVQHGFDVLDVLSHEWRMRSDAFSTEPVCARCGVSASSASRVSACAGPLEAPEERS